MCLYGLTLFLETPTSLRRGRVLYVVVSFMILTLNIMTTAPNNYTNYQNLYNAVPGSPERTRAAMDTYGGRGTPEYAVARIASTFIAFVGDGLLVSDHLTIPIGTDKTTSS